jgi:hypothetical protein
MIEEPFQGSEDELKLLITNFQRDQDKKKRELQDVRAFANIKQKRTTFSVLENPSDIIEILQQQIQERKGHNFRAFTSLHSHVFPGKQVKKLRFNQICRQIINTLRCGRLETITRIRLVFRNASPRYRGFSVGSTGSRIELHKSMFSLF